MFIYSDEIYLTLFFSVLVAALPVSIFFFRRIPKNEMKKMMQKSEEMYGISGKTSLRVSFISLIFLAVLGGTYLLYAFMNYTIFSKQSVVISRIENWSGAQYSYEQISNIYQVKFFKTSFGKRVYSPHFVIEFDDGSQWSSREHFDAIKKSEEANLLSFVVLLSGKAVVSRRYIDD